MLTLIVFLLAVYGLANAIAMLKIGVYFFGDPENQLIMADGRKYDWKELVDKGDRYEVVFANGVSNTIPKGAGDRVLRRKGLGRIPYVGDMFYCPACLSFWIGMAASEWILSPARQVCPVAWKAQLLDGLAACAASWLLHVISMRLTSDTKDV